MVKERSKEDGFEAEDVENTASGNRRDDLKKQITEATLTAITESLVTPYADDGRHAHGGQRGDHQHHHHHAPRDGLHASYAKNRPHSYHPRRRPNRLDEMGERRHGGSVATARNAHWELETDPRHAAAMKWKSAGDVTRTGDRAVPRHQAATKWKSAGDVARTGERAAQPLLSANSVPGHKPVPSDGMGAMEIDEELGGHRPSSIATRKPSTSRSSRLSYRANPFSARSGKKLTWTNVNMTLTENGGKCCSCVGVRENTNGENKERRLLKNVWGEVPEREVTAILGPSGSGKTSLLNILAGRAKSRGNLKISADVRLNNYTVNPAKQEVRKQIAFVPQDDSLQITATPREAIRFSAKMRLSRKTTEKELDNLVECMLEELGLTTCADTIVGGHMIKGISGGERKRTSVGVELVVKPALVFLDEPTSGLDSFSAVQLIQVLKKVANAGSSVLFTIHQPASEVFNSFDHVILLNAGRVMYEGEVSDIPDFFAARGYPVPSRYNPADWIMNVAQVVPLPELDKAGYFPSDQRQLLQTEAFQADEEEGRDALGITKHKKGNDEKKVTRIGFFSQVSMLFLRELQSMKRNKKPLIARYMFTTVMSTLVGVLFLGIGGMDQSDFVVFQAHFGALVLILMLSMFGTAMPSLLAFPEERPVFMREYSTDHYSVSSYFVSRLTTEGIITFPQIMLSIVITYFLIEIQMPFGYLLAVVYTLAMTSTAVAVLLGCSVEDPKMATEFLPILFVPQLLFAGFFVATELIPYWLRWAQYLCSLTYALRLALLAEFGDCANVDTSPRPNNCRVVLDNSGADENLTWMYWLVLCCLFLVFRVGALIILRKKAQKFF